MIRRVKFVGIPVKDQDRALDFYTGTLGFKIVTDKPMGDGQRWIELSIPGAPTGLALFTPKGHEDRIGTFQNLSFESDDIETTYRVLKEKGAEFDGPPKKEPWGSMMILKDPDGNTFCISERR